jgi:hypothetical protein
VFLAEDAVLWKGLGEALANQALDVAVGAADQVLQALVLDGERGPLLEELDRERARRVGERMRERESGREVHEGLWNRAKLTVEIHLERTVLGM